MPAFFLLLVPQRRYRIDPRGFRGEVVAQLTTDFPEALARRETVFLWAGGDDEPRKVGVGKAWFQKDRLVLKFAGVDSVEQAEALRDLEVQLPAREATPLPAGSFYLHDLEGCEVRDAGSGGPLGTVQRVEGAPGNFRLVVTRPGGGELPVPFAEEFCARIAPEEKLIEVTLPEGLLDRNS